MATTIKEKTTKAKVKHFGKITVPVSKAVMTQYHLKIGDVIAGKVMVTISGLVVTPSKKTPTTRVNGHARIQRKSVKEQDSDHEEWAEAIAQTFDRSFGEEPAYTSYTIKVPIPNMREGSVVIAVMSQADGDVKPRPAVVLRELPGYGDLLLCGISTRLYQMVKGFDEVIVRSDADFGNTGLHSDTLIRLGHLFALPKKFIEGEVGRIASKRHKRLLKTLSSYLLKK